MTATKAIELINKYSVCPKCGNEKVGNGAGKLYIDDNTFFRSCKCGWFVEENFKNDKNI